MKEITVVSGKGGTGKTSITSALAAGLPSLVLCDADVDAPDLHLICKPETREEHVFEGSWLAVIDNDSCTHCGICEEHCRFDAIVHRNDGSLAAEPFKCEGCRLCERLCPADAIESKRSTNNHWYVSDTRFGTMVHASMGPGEENSGKLVTRVRNTAREIAQAKGAEIILTDGPPGTGCAAIASITGCDEILLVCEPTLSSLHDAGRVIELARKFRIPVKAVINKADLHTGMRDRLYSFLSEQQVPVVLEIPFSEAMVESISQAKSIMEMDGNSSLKALFEGLSRQILDI